MTVNLLILAIGIYILIFEAYFQIDTGWGRNITIFGGGSVLVGSYLHNINKPKKSEDISISETVLNPSLNNYIKKMIIIGLVLFLIIFIINIYKYS
jgi:magnesium-transporting ATPase (P-type)